MMQLKSVSKNVMPKIIAICGAKRSGKDLLANYICKRYEYKKIRFADPLKAAIGILFNFSEDQIDDGPMKDVIDERWGIAPRKALQFFGTEILQYKIQDILPTVDRKFLAYSLVSKLKEEEYYVISDMRFVHEYEEILKLGGLIIRVDRPNKTVDQNHDVPVHTSEIEYRMIPFNIHIINDGDIADYIRKFEEQFSKIISV